MSNAHFHGHTHLDSESVKEIVKQSLSIVILRDEDGDLRVSLLWDGESFDCDYTS